MRRDIEEFRAVDAALLRIAEDRYGICEDCGSDIESERLEVHPTAIHCRHCQELRERRYG